MLSHKQLQKQLMGVSQSTSRQSENIGMIIEPSIAPPHILTKTKTKTSKNLAAAEQSSDDDSDESEGDVGYINYKDKKQRYKFNFTLEPVRDNPDGTDGVEN